jgi:indolepyruvate decarboxylase
MLAQRSWGQRGKMDMPPALAFAHGQLKAMYGDTP